MFPYYHEIDTDPFAPPTFLDANYDNNTFGFETRPDPPPPPPPASSDAAAKSAKRRGKRNDRHSKIRTAQGLRDRRMRLSVDVASRFFALQDMLGFDRASDTVDWLLKQSEPSIERARIGTPAVVVADQEFGPSPNLASRRDSRAEARARARSRTIKKKNVGSNLPISGGEFMIRDYDDTMNFFQEEFDL